MTNKPPVFYIFYTFLILGCTAFGGPIAHLAYFNRELVQRRQWLTHSDYAQLMGFCHFIPGPSSSQVGLGIGYILHGWKGAIAAWLGFTFPSAVLMTLLAVGVVQHHAVINDNTLHYLKMIALAVVAQAAWQMSKQLLHSWLARVLAMISAGIVLLIPSLLTQLAVLVLMGIIGFYTLQPTDISQADTPSTDNSNKKQSWRLPLIGISLLALLLLAIPLLSVFYELSHPLLLLFDSMYRSGTLVFGGGHVVLPLLQQTAATHSAIDQQALLAGYGAVQAMPGPLFTFAAYVGGLWTTNTPLLGAVVAIFAIFLPSFILVPTLFPLWQHYQYKTTARGILLGVNSAVIGLLVAVLYQPLMVSTLISPMDAVFTLIILALLHYARCPPWVLVIGVFVGHFFPSSIFISNPLIG